MTQHDDKIIAERKVRDGWLGVVELTAEIAGEVVKRTLIEHPSGSVVLAYDPSRKVASIVRQTRLPVLRAGSERLREPVAGVAEDELPQETAIRECLEETGIRLRSVEPIGVVWMDPSSSTERAHLFLGAYSPEDREERGGGAAGELESLDVREEPLAQLWNAVTRREPMYANLLICLQALRLKRPELFEQD